MSQKDREKSTGNNCAGSKGMTTLRTCYGIPRSLDEMAARIRGDKTPNDVTMDIVNIEPFGANGAEQGDGIIKDSQGQVVARFKIRYM